MDGQQCSETDVQSAAIDTFDIWVACTYQQGRGDSTVSW